VHSIDSKLVATVSLAITMLAVTTAIHHEALRRLSRAASGRRVTHHGVILILAALVSVHLAEIALYACAFAAGANVFGLGSLRGSSGNAALEFFYFAAETYSTLGYGDLVPVGALRVVASVEAPNGLMLLSWSGAFLFGVLDRDGRAHKERR
jgi:hypothetical protein